jgi:ankyrin repeat protein/serine/threonine protein kinase
MFEDELDALKRLSHGHLVKVMGSYTDSKYVAYLMEPIADCNLEWYLRQPQSWTQERAQALRTYFGCLASAVSYLHKQKIRHRDLKPSNVLVKDDKVYIADFSAALDSSKRGRSTTNSRQGLGTAQYMPPEVANNEPRNSKSDMWSLGVVFLEMTTVLRGLSLAGMDQFLERNGSGNKYILNNLPGTYNWFEELRKSPTGYQSDNEPLAWIKDLTQKDPLRRPSARALAKQIANSASPRSFCGPCCKQDIVEEAEEDEEDIFSTNQDDLDGTSVTDLFDPPQETRLGNSKHSAVEHWLYSAEPKSVQPNLEQDPSPSSKSELPYHVDQNESNSKSDSYGLVFDTNMDIVFGSNDDKADEPYKVLYDSDEEDGDENERHYLILDDSSESEATARPPDAESLGIIHLEEGDTDDTSDFGDEDLVATAQPRVSFKDPLSEEVVPAFHPPIEEEVFASTLREGASNIKPSLQSTTELRSHNNAPSDVPSSGPNHQHAGSIPQTGQSQGTNYPDSGSQNFGGHTDQPKGPEPSSSATVTTSRMAQIFGSRVRKSSSKSSDLKKQSRDSDAPGKLTAANLEKLSGSAPTQLPQPSPLGALPSQVQPLRDVFAETSEPTPLIKKKRSPRPVPRFSPIEYMKGTWEEASSVATSGISERTASRIASGDFTRWQDCHQKYLEYYTKIGSTSMTKALIECGCNPGTIEKPRPRPLLNAVRGGTQKHNKCAFLLIQHGANVNVCDSRTKKTPLHYAIELREYPGYTKLVARLLRAGADPNAKDANGDVPLLQILYGDYEELPKYRRDALACLLHSYFDTDVNVMPPGTLNRPLHLAVRRKDHQAVGMVLEKGADPNEKNGAGVSPLMLAASEWGVKVSKQQQDVLDQLLQYNANVNEQKVDSQLTVLHIAVSLAREDLVDLLLDYYADPYIKDNTGKTPFHYASDIAAAKGVEKHAALMKILFGSTVHNIKISEDQCPIITAVHVNDKDSTKVLLEHGAKPNHCSKSPRRPIIHHAIENGSVDMVRLLLEHNASVCLPDGNGKTPLKLAKEKNHSSIVDLLVEKGAE